MVSFRPWDVDQVWLPPASIHDFVAPEHPAHLVRDLVQRIGFGGHRLGLRGQPHYHPAMMAARCSMITAEACIPRGRLPVDVRNGSITRRSRH